MCYLKIEKIFLKMEEIVKNFKKFHLPVNQLFVIQIEPPPVPSLESIGSSLEQIALHSCRGLTGSIDSPSQNQVFRINQPMSLVQLLHQLGRLLFTYDVLKMRDITKFQ